MYIKNIITSIIIFGLLICMIGCATSKLKKDNLALKQKVQTINTQHSSVNKQRDNLAEKLDIALKQKNDLDSKVANLSLRLKENDQNSKLIPNYFFDGAVVFFATSEIWSIIRNAEKIRDRVNILTSASANFPNPYKDISVDKVIKQHEIDFVSRILQTDRNHDRVINKQEAITLYNVELNRLISPEISLLSKTGK